MDVYDPKKFMKHYFTDYTKEEKKCLQALYEADKLPTDNLILNSDEINEGVVWSAFWWLATREPARVIILCNSLEMKERAARYVIGNMATSENELPIDYHGDSSDMIRKVGPNGGLSGVSYLRLQCLQDGRELLGHNLAKTDDKPKALVIFYQCTPEEVAHYYEYTDTWAQRTIIVNEVIQPGS